MLRDRAVRTSVFVLLLTVGAVTPLRSSHAQPQTSGSGAVPVPVAPTSKAARRGVVVVLVGDAGGIDQAWSVAAAVYGERSLRPNLSDAEARVLVGETAAPTASSRVQSLAGLRARLTDDELTERALLQEIARQTGCDRIAIVRLDPTAGAPEVQIFEPTDGVLESTVFRPEPQHGHRALLATLQARALPASATERPTATTASGSSRAPAAPPRPDSNRKSFFRSPWFWGAIGSAVAAAAVVFAVSSTSSTSPPGARVDWR